MVVDEQERLRRWRLALGADAQAALGASLSGAGAGMDGVLQALYGASGGEGRQGPRQASLGGSAPHVARWLGDIRTYFPTSAVQVMQQDALERLQLRQMLLEPELLRSVTPDVHLVAALLALNNALPERTRETARAVVRQVVEQVERRLRQRLVQAVKGSLNRAEHHRRPRPQEVDWRRTIQLNLKHYQPDRRAIIPERIVGFARRQSSLRDVILCVDQSGSMAASVVYAGIFGAVLASLRALTTRLVVFDTAVVDLTDELNDPVDLLFGTQLGGGTDINRALAYCQTLVRRPAETVLILLSDLVEGGNAPEMRRRAAALVGDGVLMVCLLALNDDGSPAFRAEEAAHMARIGAPTFACTPDLFPDLLATALQGQDVAAWAARQDLVTARADR